MGRGTARSAVGGRFRSGDSPTAGFACPPFPSASARGGAAIRQCEIRPKPRLRRPGRFAGRLTGPEACLWQVLRTRPGGLKSRRQHPVGPYVLDFYCPSSKLGIEVDGVAHGMGESPTHDVARDDWLRGRGFRPCRIPARHLYGDIEPAVDLILSAAKSRCRRCHSTAFHAVPLPTRFAHGEDFGDHRSDQSTTSHPSALASLTSRAWALAATASSAQRWTWWSETWSE